MSGPQARFFAPNWSASCREAGVLLLVSVLTAGIWWARSTDRLPLQADARVYELELAAPLMTIAQARAVYDEGVSLFIDTRSATGGVTIPGALFVRDDTFDDDLLANFDFMFPDDQLVLFGDGDLTRTSNVAGRLLDRGYLNLQILSGGLAAWQSNQGPVSNTDEGTKP